MSASARLASTPLSILDLAHIRQGGTPSEAFRNSRVLAQRANPSITNASGSLNITIFKESRARRLLF